MAELTTAERLQPALLDRLRDDEPGTRLESRDKRVMSVRQLRAAVLRDLSWLLNSSCKSSEDEVNLFPEVARSVVNFGMPDLTGLCVSGISVERLEEMVADAIAAFEPRIMRQGLSVRAIGAEDSRGHNVVSFEIVGQMCPLPMPEALFLRTEVDLETGRCDVREGAR